MVRARDEQRAIDVCVLVTEHGGLGHTSAIYARDEPIIERFSAAVRTGRILVNAPTAVGALGGVYNSLTPTFSLGCGTWGGSATTDNVNYRNLLNIKTVSRRRVPPQWFRVPSDTYFNAGSLESLRQVEARQIVVVTDAFNEKRGAVDEVRKHLRTSPLSVFAHVEPEPDETIVQEGVRLLDQVQPDVIIAVGGGSVLDAAKVMRLVYEHPERVAQRPRAAVPRRPQARRRLPDRHPFGAPHRDPDHRRDRLRGVTGGGHHDGPHQGDARRLLARAGHGHRGSDAHPQHAAGGDGRHRASTR